MDENVRLAMEKWPNVPDLFGWLELATTGRWLIKGEPILHGGLNEFIGRNYMADDRGRWYFQNGPQRVYVDLEYTPWVLHVDGTGRLRDQTDALVEPGGVAAVDDAGNLLIETARGIGLIDSAALAVVTDWLLTTDGEPASDDALAAVMAGQEAEGVIVDVGGRRLPLERIHAADVPARFGFIQRPSEEEATDS